jgi:predicted O-methyltransferase YrrM
VTAISTYYGLLRRAHEIIRPEVYLEIGVHEGYSLALVQSGTRAVCVDPEPKVADPPPDTTIVAATSDEFFARPDVDELLGGPVDLAFVDGLHLHEQTLRDLANVERHSHPDGVILIHDCLPIDAVTSARERTTVVWSGDVWKVVVALRRHRPDLGVTTVDVEPTGIAVVTGLDPASTVLNDAHDDIVADLATLDYEELIERGRDETLGVVPGQVEVVDALLTR